MNYYFIIDSHLTNDHAILFLLKYMMQSVAITANVLNGFSFTTKRNYKIKENQV